VSGTEPAGATFPASRAPAGDVAACDSVTTTAACDGAPGDPVAADLSRNGLGHYDLLCSQWWDPQGSFAMLHWLAVARARLIPRAPCPGAVLVDVGCGGGLLAPHVRELGYRHLGIDLTVSALSVAREHGLAAAARADATALPVAAEAAHVVVAGELLEHVPDPMSVVAECCRVLAPGGTLVFDTIADTRLARFLAVTVAERLPGGAPPGLHDPALFVNRRALAAAARRGGVELTLTGVRPRLGDALRWLLRRRCDVRLIAVPTTAVLFQACGRKTSQ
jgi:2-polyprenyl-6-hydroxyphenyl methylase/3-demethylubiquinone-9 3-methyltransferase